MKAASPRIGGMICPEVEATDSMAPAMEAWNPFRFIMGMVNRPVSTTLDTAWPITDATMPLPMRAGKAAPPLIRRPLSLPTSMTILRTPTPRRIAAYRIKK